MAGQQHEPTGVSTSGSRAKQRPACQQAACSAAPQPQLNGPFHTSHLGRIRRLEDGAPPQRRGPGQRGRPAHRPRWRGAVGYALAGGLEGDRQAGQAAQGDGVPADRLPRAQLQAGQAGQQGRDGDAGLHPGQRRP
jgi:hypothetical protein